MIILIVPPFHPLEDGDEPLLAALEGVPAGQAPHVVVHGLELTVVHLKYLH